jgi:hypothetical protein
MSGYIGCSIKGMRMFGYHAFTVRAEHMVRSAAGFLLPPVTICHLSRSCKTFWQAEVA